MRPARGVLLSLPLALLVLACSGTEETETQTLAKLAGDAQQGTAGLAVATAPSVKITNQNNQGVAGIAVTFAVASGGGSLTGGTATTGSDGVAAVGSWTLGQTVGANTLTATAANVTGSPVTFTATGAAGAAKTVTKETGTDNQNANAGEAVAVKPAVKVVDQFGNPVAGVTVAFAIATGGGSVTSGNATTGANGVATVGNWFVGAAAGANTLTATVTGAGITGNPATFTATSILLAFNPAANTQLSGTKTYSSVNIPAGVTVTMTGDLTLNVAGAVTIAGNLVGDCVNLTINAEGALTVSGNLNNGCAGAIPAAGPPAIVLVGKGGYTLQGPGSFTAGGDFTVTNDPTLTDANFAPGAAAPRAQIRAKGDPQAIGEPCIINNYDGQANPTTAQAGSDLTPNGTNGKDGATWTLRCNGGSDILISGALTLAGQHGGRGGNGTHSSATAAVSVGGNGGKGGTVKIQALKNISWGPGSTIFTGNGGAGGSATATGTPNGGAIETSGTATGGSGGAPGLFSAIAKNGTLDITGASTIQVGDGGRGGNATATGADGHNAPPCVPGAGGAATATAGAGGSTPNKSLTAQGAVTGLNNVTVVGGAPGAGGDGVATAGNGGNGAQPCKPGAVGGAPTAKGGKGGDAALKDQNGAQVANGGSGGSMEVKNGKGGQGFNGCSVNPTESGGAGGAGGIAGGFNGAGGIQLAPLGIGSPTFAMAIGLAPGVPGAAKFTTVSNGGNGGDGNGPGALGPAGANQTAITVAPVTVQPSFVPGTPGNPCAPAAPDEVSLGVVAFVTTGVVTPGTYTWNLLDAVGTAVGTILVSAEGPLGTHFRGQNPDRVGWSGTSAWVVDLASAIVNGAAYAFSQWQECILNTTVDATNPVDIEELDANGNVLVTHSVTSLAVIAPSSSDGKASLVPAAGCPVFDLNQGTKKIRTKKTGKGSSADMNKWKGKKK